MTDEQRQEGVVLAIDNVPLDLHIASAASRSVAAFLDYLIVAVLSLLWGVACMVLVKSWGARGYWLLAVGIVGLFLIDYGYFAGVEAVTGGRTFGKWVVGLSVVTDRGGRPGTPALLLRNAVRSADLFVGLPLMAIDTRSRRLGDRLAGTLVVHVDDLRSSDVALGRIPLGWGGREVAIAEDFLRRVGDLEPARAERLARALVSLVGKTDPALLAKVPASLDPAEQLRQLLQPRPSGTAPVNS